MIEEMLPAALHNTGQYEINRVEGDHRRLKARLGPMRGVKANRTASVVIRGHAFIQNVRRGHYELPVDAAQPRSGWPPHSTNGDPPHDHVGVRTGTDGDLIVQPETPGTRRAEHCTPG